MEHIKIRRIGEYFFTLFFMDHLFTALTGYLGFLPSVQILDFHHENFNIAIIVI